jgi:hypothetical protein
MPDTSNRPAGLAIVGWKPMPRNSLRGFADIKLPSGLIIREAVVHNTNGRAWVNLPGKPMVDRDGQAVRDPATGKLKYAALLEWSDRAVADRFSAAVIDAIEAQHPGAVR